MSIAIRPLDLPDFRKPPVTEVVLGLQMAALPLNSFHPGILKAKFQNKYPATEEHPALLPIFEVFGNPGDNSPISRIEWQIGTQIPSRFWYLSEDKANILQFQHDAIIRNWVKRSADVQYPRYESLLESFRQDLTTVDSFLEEQRLGKIKVTQAEVTYVNTIELPGDYNPHRHLEKIFRIWSNTYSDDDGVNLEDATVQLRYLIKDQDGKAFGRLHGIIEPSGFSKEGVPQVRFTLTVRGKPAQQNVNAAVEFWNVGRRNIVKKFASITRPEMHGLWERTDGDN